MKWRKSLDEGVLNKKIAAPTYDTVCARKAMTFCYNLGQRKITGEWIMYTFVAAIPLKPTVWSNVCRNRPRRHGYACLAGVDDLFAGRPYWPVTDQWAVWSVGAACGQLRHDHSNLLARRTEETTMGEGARYVDDFASRANVNIDLTCCGISVFLLWFEWGFHDAW